MDQNQVNEMPAKKPIWKRWWFWAIIVVIIIGMASSGESNKDATTSMNPVTTTTETTAPEPTPAPTWQEVIKFEGESIKNTETFHISSDEWRIVWSTKPGEYGDMNFQIFVYEDDGSMVINGIAANVIGEGQDTSYMRGSGDYYLTINTAQPYQIIVQEKK